MSMTLKKAILLPECHTPQTADRYPFTGKQTPLMTSVLKLTAD